MPCKGGTPPLSEEEYAPLLGQLRGWDVLGGTKLRKTFEFKNFVDAARTHLLDLLGDGSRVDEYLIDATRA